MRAALVNKIERTQDYDTIAKENRDFWINGAPKLFSGLEDTYVTDFRPKCTFIFDILREELSNQ